MSRDIKNQVVPEKSDEFIDVEGLKSTLEELRKRRSQAIATLNFLDIPVDINGTVHAHDLVKILMDDEKCNVLFKKLKNKAFW